MDVSQYLEIFIDESSEHLQSLSDCIMVLEKEPDNKDTINEIFRAAHSLKGMAGTMGFKRMKHVTHDMENVFQEVRSEKISVDSSMIDLLFECLDALDGYLENIKASSDEGTNDNELIIKKLNNFLAKANGEVVAPAEAEPAKAEETPAAEESAPQADDSSYERKFRNIEMSDYEKKEIATAREEGLNIYGFTIYVQKECLLKAARAFLVFRAVEEFGRIVVYSPSSQDIEDEKFELDFSFIVSSAEELSKIIAAAKNVSEIEEVVGEVVPVETKPVAQAEDVSVALEETKPAAVSRTVEPASNPSSTVVKKQAPAKAATNRRIILMS